MNRDEPHFERKMQKFSVVKKCPKCGQLSLSYKDNEIYCENCGYTQNVPSAR